jgi:hypothetical protein
MEPLQRFFMWPCLIESGNTLVGHHLISDRHNVDRMNMVVLHKVWPAVEANSFGDRRLTKPQFYKQCREVEGSLTHTLEDADAIKAIRASAKQAFTCAIFFFWSKTLLNSLCATQATFNFPPNVKEVMVAGARDVGVVCEKFGMVDLAACFMELAKEPMPIAEGPDCREEDLYFPTHLAMPESLTKYMVRPHKGMFIGELGPYDFWYPSTRYQFILMNFCAMTLSTGAGPAWGV